MVVVGGSGGFNPPHSIGSCLFLFFPWHLVISFLDNLVPPEGLFKRKIFNNSYALMIFSFFLLIVSVCADTGRARSCFALAVLSHDQRVGSVRERKYVKLDFGLLMEKGTK